MPATYKAPAIPASKITPQFVRNELLTCFESANREFARVLKQPVTEAAVKQQVRQFVTTVFSQCGVSFEKPTKEGQVHPAGMLRSLQRFFPFSFIE